MTNKQLQKMFDQFNERFFEDKISGVKVCFARLPKHDGFYRFSGQILISHDLRSHSEIVKLVLLHEMNHAHIIQSGYIGHEEDGGHSTTFHVGIDRLYKIGAYEGLL